MSRRKPIRSCRRLLSAVLAAVAVSNAPRRAQRVAAVVVENCSRRVSIIAAAATTTHRRRPRPTRPRRPRPCDRFLERAADDGDIAVTTIGIVRNEHSRSLSREDQGFLLVKPAGSASATDVVSIIHDANCPHRSVTCRVVVDSCRGNLRRQIS